MFSRPIAKSRLSSLPQHLWVRVFVPEPWLGLIKVGDTVRVRVDSFPDRDFAGARRADQSPGGIHAAQCADGRGSDPAGLRREDSFANNEDKLRAGMSADVYFPNVSKSMNPETRRTRR